MSNNTEVPLGFLASRILDVPLMITQTKLNQILDVIGGRIGINKSVTIVQNSVSHPGPQAARQGGLNVFNGIAQIPIYGTLVHRTHGLSALSGMTSYASIRSQFNSALKNTDIHSILLEIDSPGGEVAGVFDLIDTIYNARGTKPIIAMINESGYSAAYGIASAADKVYLTRTAGSGSIGVIMLHVNRSEADKKAGVTYTPIYAGSKKIDGSPHAPLSDSARETAQAVVDSMYSLFTSTVARNVGLSEQTVRKTQAGTYHGQSAVDIGLAHAVLSYQEVINQLVTQKGGTKLPMAEKPEKPEKTTITETSLESTLVDDTKNVSTTAADPKASTQPISPNDIDALVQARVKEAITAERERCVAILEACTIAEVINSAKEYLSDGSTLETAHKMIMAVLAERSNQTTVTSTVNPAVSGETNPLLADAKRRAGAMKQGY